MKLKKIIFTGGGSGGHVIPAIGLIRELKKESFDIHYIGRGRGIERDLIAKEDIHYKSISTGKLRRYLSFENIVDFFKVFRGIMQCFLILMSFKKKETVIFSTGGFVAVPLVISAGLLGFCVLVHEQTSRRGLANRISSFFANKILLSFSESKKFFPERKTLLTGYPLRDGFFQDGLDNVLLDNMRIDQIQKPILFVTGGGNGSRLINRIVKENRDYLKKHYFVIHQVGADFIEEYRAYKDTSYLPMSFIGDEIISIYKKARIVISRSGAGTVCELMALGKKSIFIPLAMAQRDEQYHNAMEAKKLLGSWIVKEDKFLSSTLPEMLERFMQEPETAASGQKKNPKFKIIEEIKKSLD